MVFNLRSFSSTESIEDNPTPPKSFSLEELRVATDNFSRDKFWALGNNYEVYQGRLADGSPVAVKRESFVNRQREEEFEEEVRVGSRVSTQPNVLCLRGFCRTKKELLLVYPLMVNNSLSYNLRDRPDRFARPLDWSTRKRVALGAARGLAHLHNQGNIKIMHRNICTSNVLLNEHFEAVIGGFSLAMIMHERNVEEGTIEWSTFMPRLGSYVHHRYEDVYVNTPAICGRPGFVAPEYKKTKKCTMSNDVFAYGNMLLELVSGRAIYSDDGEAFWPEDWVRKLMNEDQLERVIDPNLQGNYVAEEAERLLRLAMLCSDEDPSIRPEMSEVVRMLESQFLQRDTSTRTSWSESECDSSPYYSLQRDSTPYNSLPPSPSPSPSHLGIAP